MVPILSGPLVPHRFGIELDVARVLVDTGRAHGHEARTLHALRLGERILETLHISFDLGKRSRQRPGHDVAAVGERPLNFRGQPYHDGDENSSAPRSQRQAGTTSSLLALHKKISSVII